MIGGRALALSCAVACAGACAPDDLFRIPPIVWSGEHLDYAPQEHAAPVCAGTPPYMDRYMDLLAADMDVEIGRSVYVHGSPDDPSPCDDDALACFHDGAVIYSPAAPHEHELVHAVRFDVGHPMKFFEEGAAEMFGGDDLLGSHIEPADGSLRDGMEAGRRPNGLPLDWYQRAGNFSAYLHRYHGPEVTMALLLETSQSSTVDEAIAVLEAATAMPFDELVADFEWQEPFCMARQWYRYPIYPCDAPEALRERCDGDVAVPIEESLACDDPAVLGPREGEVFKYVAFDVPTDGIYTLRAADRAGGDDGWIELKECRLGCSSSYIALPYDGLDTGVILRAGRYSLRMTRHADRDTPASMAVTIAGDDCR
jgi:hypothetical protein